MKTYYFDIDGYIAKTEGSDYLHSQPIKEVIYAINRLYEQGNKIVYFTGRGSISGKDWKEFTREQLNQWGVKYSELNIGNKPHFDRIGDDKMITINELLSDKTMEDCLIADIVKAYKNGNKVLICGNGGLCAESEHFVAELVGKYGGDVYLSAIALTNNTSLITALANDFGFQFVFSHQIRVFGNKGDILIAMTTSQSINIIEALASGKEKGMITVAISSTKSDTMIADYQFRMYGKDTAEVQNEIIKFLHRIAYEVKRIYVN